MSRDALMYFRGLSTVGCNLQDNTATPISLPPCSEASGLVRQVFEEEHQVGKEKMRVFSRLGSAAESSRQALGHLCPQGRSGWDRVELGRWEGTTEKNHESTHRH